ncbi:hypothetical protein BDZ89DRAFT_1236794 [Hymenopellis radicata]|nr:hypothetical protein BDZ89DRAFT_1236794 [Hymenopellis radicata]
MTVTCDQCYRSFVSDNALHNHCSAKADHPYCDECERLFRHDQALQQHLANAAVHQGDSDEYESDESDEGVYCTCGRCDRCRDGKTNVFLCSGDCLRVRVLGGLRMWFHLGDCLRVRVLAGASSSLGGSAWGTVLGCLRVPSSSSGAVPPGGLSSGV